MNGGPQPAVDLVRPEALVNGRPAIPDLLNGVLELPKQR